MSGMTEVNKIAAEAVSGGDEAIAELIATGLGLIHVLQVYTSSMMAVAVWDWLVCLKMEYDRIWKRKWSLVKFLYLWTRYYGLLCFALNLWLFNDNFTFQACKKLHYLIAATCMWTTLGSEAILAVRTYAFLAKNKYVGIGLSLGLIGETAFLLYVSIAGVHQTGLALGTKGPCTASDFPGKHVVSGFWLAPVAFDLICTFLTLAKAFQTRHIHMSPLLVTFIREGLFYFLAVAAVNVLNAAFMFQSNANIQNINSFLALILSQCLCCRLVLNLRAPNHTHEAATYSARSAPSRPNPSAPGYQRSNGFPVGSPAQMKSGAVNIPLHSFSQDDSEDYGGVKVQVDVETDSDRNRKQ